MMKRTIRIQSSQWGLMLFCLLGAPVNGISQIDFQETREINSVFPNEGSIRTVDIDFDGDLDMLVMGRTYNETIFTYDNFSKLLINDGAGNFSVQETPFDGAHAGDAEFADVDEDGDLDVVIVGNYKPGIAGGRLYFNNGQGGFTVADPDPIPEVHDSAAEFFDFNGDSHLDLFVSGGGGAGGDLRVTKVLTGDGKGNFVEVPDTGLPLFTRSSASIGDIDGDLDEDIIISGLPVNYWETGTYVFFKEDGRFGQKTKLTTIYGGDTHLADFDQDGDLDLMNTGADDFSRKVEYFQNDGKGKFTPVLDQPFVHGAKRPEISAEDFDLDGDLDVFISGSNGDVLQNHLYLNDGKGNFKLNDYPLPVTKLMGSGIGNFDGKGFYDILFFGEEKQKARILFNNIELNEPPTVTSVQVRGEALVNYEFEGSYSFYDKEGGEDHSSFQWYRADDAAGNNITLIEGATLNRYLMTELDEGKYLSLEITPSDGSLAGPVVQSGWSGPVMVPVPEILVSGNSVLIPNGSLETSIENHSNFGEVKKSGIISKTFILGNNGKANLIIEEILISGENKEEFSVVTQEVLPILPGEKTTFTVEFSPTGIGNRSAMVTITSNDPQDFSFNFKISGEGLNSPPVINTGGFVEISENFSGEIIDINASDGEGGLSDEGVNYSITGGEDQDLFQINHTTGSLSFISAPDFEKALDSDADNIYILEVTADDGETEENLTVQTIRIAVNNLDELPVAICKEGVSVTLNAEGKATITAEDLDAGSSDDMGITEILVEPNVFSCTDVGPVTIILSVKDSGGHIVSCTTTIKVIDDRIPTITSVEPIHLGSTPGKCGASITIIAPKVLDNCGSWDAIGTRSDGLTFVDLFPIGETTITWKTDPTSLGEDVRQIVRVVDSESPWITPVEPIIVNNDSGKCGASIVITPPVVLDNCGSWDAMGTRSDNLPLVDPFPVGKTTITWRIDATDRGNGVDQIVTVIDSESPRITPLEPISVTNDPGECGASVTITPPKVLDNCGSWDAIGTRNDGLFFTDRFPIGETTITWKTDVTSLGEDLLQTVIVMDTEAPVISEVEPVVRDNDPGSNGALIQVVKPEVSDCLEVILTGKRSDGMALDQKFPVGETIITWDATDGKNLSLPVEQKIIVRDNELPIISAPQNITVVSSGGNCGTLVNIAPPVVIDNCDVSQPPIGIREDNLPLNDKYPVGTTKIKWTAIDVNQNEAIALYQMVSVSVRNPDEITLTGPEGPQKIGSAIEMMAGFTDENFIEANWKILEGGVEIQKSENKSIASNIRQISHSFENLPAGVYTVTLTLKYDCGKEVIKNHEYVVIYDPNGGFVTGGGWIHSPAGAMREQGKLTEEGKANFGFNAKYKSGKNEVDQVDGETNFQFKAGDLLFKSSSHEAMSLVVSGGFKATYKGIGALNGEEGYNFMVTVIDADETENYTTDHFRIKIWKGGIVVYDNNILNKAEDADPATEISGGSIVIHKPQLGNKTSVTDVSDLQEKEIGENLEVFFAYPNPMESSAIIEFGLTSSTNVILSLYDLNGREVQRLYEGKVDEKEVYKIEVHKNNIMSGTYIFRLTTGLGNTYQKQLMVK